MAATCPACRGPLEASRLSPHLSHCPTCASQVLPPEAKVLPLMQKLPEGERSGGDIRLTDEFRRMYTLESLLGAGAMGAVYAARQTGTEKAVAIKFLTRLDSTEALKRFREETRLLAGLDHPNVISVMDAGSIAGHPYLVAERLDGGTLREKLVDQGRLPVEDALAIFADLLAGLAACHDAGIVHRDLKPENILFDHRGTTKLADLGIARHFDHVNERLTLTGSLIGTPRYMSPEQINGEPAIYASDLYATGLILHEMLYGFVPLCGRTLAELFVARRTQRVELPPSTSVRPELGRFLLRLLSFDVAARPSTAREAVTALAALSSSSAQTETTTSLPAPAPLQPGASPTAASPAAASAAASAFAAASAPAAVPGRPRSGRVLRPGASGSMPAVGAGASAASASAASASAAGASGAVAAIPRPAPAMPQAVLSTLLLATGFGVGWLARGQLAPLTPVTISPTITRVHETSLPPASRETGAPALLAGASPAALASTAPPVDPAAALPPALAGGRAPARVQGTVRAGDSPAPHALVAHSTPVVFASAPAASAAPRALRTPARPQAGTAVAAASPSAGPRPALTDFAGGVTGWVAGRTAGTLSVLREVPGTAGERVVLCVSGLRDALPVTGGLALKVRADVEDAPAPALPAAELAALTRTAGGRIGLVRKLAVIEVSAKGPRAPVSSEPLPSDPLSLDAEADRPPGEPAHPPPGVPPGGPVPPPQDAPPPDDQPLGLQNGERISRYVRSPVGQFMYSPQRGWLDGGMRPLGWDALPPDVKYRFPRDSYPDK